MLGEFCAKVFLLDVEHAGERHFASARARVFGIIYRVHFLGFSSNSAELAGFRVRASSLPRAIPNLSRLSGAFFSAGKIPFPGNGDWGSQRPRFESEINEQEDQIVEGIDRAQATLF